jgi:PPOX class probable F420-dependent enzyme
MNPDKAALFAHYTYVNLETFKKDGSGVKTPLFFVEHEGVLYMRTPRYTGKIKRIRRNPRVRIAPSDRRGEAQGEWMDGQAEIHEATEMQWVNDLVKRKYGLAKRLIDLRNKLLGREGMFVVIAVRLE